MDSSHTKEPASQCKSLSFFLKSFRSLFAKGREKEAVLFLALCKREKKKQPTKKNHNRTGNYIQTISISIKAGTSPKGKNQNTCFISKAIERLTATTWSPKQPCMSEDGKSAVSLTSTQDEWWSMKASTDEEFTMCRVLDQGTRKDYEINVSKWDKWEELKNKTRPWNAATEAWEEGRTRASSRKSYLNLSHGR